jgi:hypothetical protein
VLFNHLLWAAAIGVTPSRRRVVWWFAHVAAPLRLLDLGPVFHDMDARCGPGRPFRGGTLMEGVHLAV